MKNGKPRVTVNARKLPPFRRTEIAPETPAPQTQAMIEKEGLELTTQATEAWAARLSGMPMVDVAHNMGVSLVTAKALLNEAHAAIAEDLKGALELNRTLDLARIDGMLQTYYPSAKAGDLDSANFILKALGHRSKLTGIEPPPDARSNNQPMNVLCWIQAQMPSINKIVDALPIE